LGHPLYPEGDPRYRLLVDALTGVRPDHPMAADLRAIEETVDDRGLPPPNVDMALGAIVVGLGLPPNSGELLFATGRMAGWVAHALEAYAQGSPIRPRARYVGAR
jgi:citrate synthase